MTRLFVLFSAALVVSLALVPLTRHLARTYGYVAKPKEKRWHKRPTALMGGAALSVTVIGLIPLVADTGPIWALLVGAGVMFAVGLFDDIKSLKPSTKLVVQVAVASLLVFDGYRLEWVESLTGDTLLTLFWIVGITNAFNLLDNMDGLCTGVALVAGFSLLVAYGGGALDQATVAYLVLLLGASAGFLVYNVHPASIFLGDSGSLFIGLSLSTLALGLDSSLGSQPNVLAVIAVPVFVLLIPIFDTTLVTFSRIVTGRTPAVGGRDHSSHRLVAIGLSERSAVMVLWALAAVGGVVAVFARYATPDWSILLAALVVLAMATFAIYLSHVHVYDDADEAALKNNAVTPLVVEFLYKRRVAEVILDVGLVAVAYYSAYRLRFEGTQWGDNFGLFLQSLPVLVGVQLLSLFVVGAYRGVWRYFTLVDGVVFVKGVLVGTLAAVAAIVFAYRFDSYSRTVFVIYAVIVTLLLIGSRSSFRLINELVRRRRYTGSRLIVYGADDTGIMALRKLSGNLESRFRMLGFIDDDNRRHGQRVDGYLVLGGHDKLLTLIETGKVDTVVLCVAVVNAERLTALKRVCTSNGVSLSRMQVDMQHLIAG